jgi:hypothetical protein
MKEVGLMRPAQGGGESNKKGRKNNEELLKIECLLGRGKEDLEMGIQSVFMEASFPSWSSIPCLFSRAIVSCGWPVAAR